MVLVGIGGWILLRDGNGLLVLVGREGVVHVNRREVLASIGTKADGAEVHSLGVALLATLNRKCVATAVFVRDLPRTLGPSILSYCHAKDQKHDFDDSV